MKKLSTNSPYLYKRGENTYLRIKFPPPIAIILQTSEYKKSLGVIPKKKAIGIAYAMRVALDRVATMVEDKNITPERIKQLIQNHYLKITKDIVLGYQFKTNEADFEITEQKGLAEDAITIWENNLASANIPTEFSARATEILEEANIDKSSISDENFKIICRGLIRAHIEKEKMYVANLDDYLSAYEPVDPLFHNLKQIQAIPVSSVSSPHIVNTSFADNKITIKQAFEEFKTKRLKDYDDKDISEVISFIRKFLIVLGGDKPLAAVSKADVVNFRDTLSNFKKGVQAAKAKSINELITDDETKKINYATAQKYMGWLKQFFTWAYKDGKLDTNPSDVSGIKAPANSKSIKKRRPFTKEELEILFSGPTFLGCLSKTTHGRYKPGNYKIKDDRYWVPILGFYTGARENEILQMHFSDIVVDGEFPHFKFRVETEDEGINNKSLKTKAALRIFPIHPDILDLGFADYVKSQKKMREKGENRLFWTVKYSNTHGTMSDIFSKRFRAILTHAGKDGNQNIKLMAGNHKLDFHSFRHNLIDSLTNGGVEITTARRLVGHSIGGMSTIYGMGLWESTGQEIIQKAKFLIDLKALLLSKA